MYCHTRLFTICLWSLLRGGTKMFPLSIEHCIVLVCILGGMGKWNHSGVNFTRPKKVFAILLPFSPISAQWSMFMTCFHACGGLFSIMICSRSRGRFPDSCGLIWDPHVSIFKSTIQTCIEMNQTWNVSLPVRCILDFHVPSSVFFLLWHWFECSVINQSLNQRIFLLFHLMRWVVVFMTF